jgi:hypothetical protein
VVGFAGVLDVVAASRLEPAFRYGGPACHTPSSSQSFFAELSVKGGWGAGSGEL